MVVVNHVIVESGLPFKGRKWMAMFVFLMELMAVFQCSFTGVGYTPGGEVIPIGGQA